MARALRLAERGRGAVSPNPMVGAVVVKNDRVLGEGWHRTFGAAHAEVEALERAGTEARGAALFVTLEPCAHFGKTPPCTAAILAAGITRVVVAIRDPNPRVAGGGARLLEKRGVTVEVGLLEGKARELNRGFLTWITEGRPLVTVKLAQSLDGRIATRNGDSKWITGEEARRETHRLRARHDALLVGGATVAADNPELTVRHVRGRNPVRVVVDPELKTSRKARWLREDGTRRIVAATRRSALERRAGFAAAGAEVWILPAGPKGGVSIKALTKRLAEAGLVSVMVEGGGRLAGAFLSRGLVDRLRVFTAPILLGGEGRPWTEGLKVPRIKAAPVLREANLRKLGRDWLVEGEF